MVEKLQSLQMNIFNSRFLSCKETELFNQLKKKLTLLNFVEKITTLQHWSTIPSENWNPIVQRNLNSHLPHIRLHHWAGSTRCPTTEQRYPTTELQMFHNTAQELHSKSGHIITISLHSNVQSNQATWHTLWCQTK